MSSTLRYVTSLLLIATPLIFAACLTLLQATFNYPDILREPTDSVLRGFTAGGPGLVATWYGAAFSALLFIPLAMALHLRLAPWASPYLVAGTVFGVLAGLVQALGFLRWVFVVPYLAEAYVAPAATQATRDAVEVVFQTFNRYAGMAVGEHLGYIFTALWLGTVCLAVRRSRLLPAWLTWTGLALAVGIAIGVFEALGVQAAGTINLVSYTLWVVWLIAVGVVLFRARPEPREMPLRDRIMDAA